MDQITPQRIGELLRIIFELLWYQPEGLPAREVLARIPSVMQLTEYETSISPSFPEVPRYETILRLATIPLVKAGWFIKDAHGRWALTDEGRQAAKQFADAGEFYREATRLYNDYFERKRGRPATYLALEEARERSWEQIQVYLTSLRPYEFKALVSDLLRTLGYHVTWVVPPEQDRGKVDFIATTDALGASQPRIVVQVKHKGQAATAEGLQAFLDMLGPNDFGMLICAGGFTNAAREEALNQKQVRFVLVDMEKFFELWIEHFEELVPEGKIKFPLEPVYFLSPMD